MNESKPAKRYIYRAYANKQVVSKQTKLAKIPSTLLALAGRDSFRVWMLFGFPRSGSKSMASSLFGRGDQIKGRRLVEAWKKIKAKIPSTWIDAVFRQERHRLFQLVVECICVLCSDASIRARDGDVYAPGLNARVTANDARNKHLWSRTGPRAIAMDMHACRPCSGHGTGGCSAEKGEGSRRATRLTGLWNDCWAEDKPFM